MKQLTIGTDIDATRDIVWDVIARFEHWRQWGTTIRGVEADSDRVDVGVTGRVQTIVGPWLPFRITAVDQGRFWTWNVAGFPATGHRVIPIDAARSRVEFTVAWPLAPYAVPMWLAVRRIEALAIATQQTR